MKLIGGVFEADRKVRISCQRRAETHRRMCPVLALMRGKLSRKHVFGSDRTCEYFCWVFFEMCHWQMMLFNERQCERLNRARQFERKLFGAGYFVLH